LRYTVRTSNFELQKLGDARSLNLARARFELRRSGGPMRRIKLTRLVIVALLALAPAMIVARAVPQATGEEIVYVTKSGKKYHLEDCRTLKGKTKFTMKLKDAVDGGYEPCKVCHPPVLPKEDQ
jgi:hypothetical protein